MFPSGRRPSLGSDDELSDDPDGLNYDGVNAVESRDARRCEHARIMSLRFGPSAATPLSRAAPRGQRAEHAFSRQVHSSQQARRALRHGAMVRRFWGAAKSIASADDGAVVVPGGTYDPLGVGGPDDPLGAPPCWSAV
jgi:hypothetical protein